MAKWSVDWMIWLTICFTMSTPSFYKSGTDFFFNLCLKNNFIWFSQFWILFSTGNNFSGGNLLVFNFQPSEWKLLLGFLLIYQGSNKVTHALILVQTTVGIILTSWIYRISECWLSYDVADQRCNRIAFGYSISYGLTYSNKSVLDN